MNAEGRKYWRDVVENLKKMVAACETVSELLNKNKGQMELVYGDELDLVNETYTVEYEGGEFNVIQREGCLDLDPEFVIENDEYRCPMTVRPEDIEE